MRCYTLQAKVQGKTSKSAPNFKHKVASANLEAVFTQKMSHKNLSTFVYVKYIPYSSSNFIFLEPVLTEL